MSRKRKSELVISVNSQGTITKSVLALPTKNIKVFRDKTPSVSAEYRTLSQKIAEKVKMFKEQQRKNYYNELALRKNSSIVIANSLNKVINNVNNQKNF